MNDELHITDLQPGTGKAAVKGALILTQYRGTLEDGTEFDSSYRRGKPFQCVIGTGRVIKGWDIGLMGMKVGGRRRLWVPAHLAYGERQVGERIRPNSNLIFEIELLEVLIRDDGAPSTPTPSLTAPPAPCSAASARPPAGRTRRW
jgi:peptidylprolyl isomerase